MLRRHHKSSHMSFFRRIVSNARGKSIPSISITYVYRWHFEASHRCQHATPTVDHPLWGGERNSFTWTEIQCNAIRDTVFHRVVSSTSSLRLLRGPSGLPGFRSATNTSTYSGRCFSETSLNMLAMSLDCSAGAYFRSSPRIQSHPHPLLLLSLANAVSASLAVIGESSDFGEPSNISTPCSIPSWNWFSRCFATIDGTLSLSQ